MASEVLLALSKDENERARLLSEYKYEVDLQSNLVAARRETQEEERQKFLEMVNQVGSLEELEELKQRLKGQSGGK